MSVAILFSGQGKQTATMGADLYAEDGNYRQVIDAANQQLNWDLTAPLDVQDPQRVPVAIAAMSLGIYAALQPSLPQPAALLGLSLGEYSALMAAKAFSMTDGLKLVADRARYMQRASVMNPGMLVAALKVTPALVAQACQAGQAVGQAYPANYNLADQVVIGGDVRGVRAAMASLTAQGVKRLVPLQVSAASHTPLMAPASTALAQRLTHLTVRTPQLPVWSNTTVTPFTATTLKATLVDQLVQPTHFYADLQALAQRGVETFIQVGPGSDLAKFAKKAVPTARVMNVATSEDLAAVRTNLKAVTR
ncbi:ACP S-malonyltransferase [Lactiplantibacillus fabifermentans]|nr:ACP S-malonyltransferase [Lactiplantibacillus fabifermentans]ETY74406.1 ACP S-malonyltransferase [Lactiplantibacillus fabifermentans T30PCM01]